MSGNIVRQSKKTTLLEKQGGNIVTQGIYEVSKHLTLAVKLMVDRRVPFWAKVTPVALYTVYFMTVDWVLWGPIDDIGVLVLAYMLFVQLCDKKIVKELSK